MKLIRVLHTVQSVLYYCIHCTPDGVLFSPRASRSISLKVVVVVLVLVVVVVVVVVVVSVVRFVKLENFNSTDGAYSATISTVQYSTARKSLHFFKPGIICII